MGLCKGILLSGKLIGFAKGLVLVLIVFELKEKSDLEFGFGE